jgi:hypothetical protein
MTPNNDEAPAQEADASSNPKEGTVSNSHDTTPRKFPSPVYREIPRDEVALAIRDGVDYRQFVHRERMVQVIGLESYRQWKLSNESEAVR